MPLDSEFKKHLHSLMVEVHDQTVDENELFKRERLWQARQTHNGAAIPLAYVEAALHAMENRVGRTIAKYLEAVTIWGFEITPAVEKAMINEFMMLTAGPNQLHLPPGIRWHHVQPVQGHYARERAKLANRLVREGTNRLRELKIKSRRGSQQVDKTTNIFNGAVGNAYINSTVQMNNSFTIAGPVLEDIERLSDQNPELKAAAIELTNAPEGVGKLQKFITWVTLANSVTGLAEKIHQHYPQVEALLASLKRLG